MKAIRKKNKELVARLLAKEGIKLNVKDINGRTAIMHAIEIKSAEMVRILLYECQNGDKVDLNEYDNRGRSVLIHAILKERVDILKLLFEFKEQTITVQWKDELSYDACEYASSAKQKEVKLMLMDYIVERKLEYLNSTMLRASIEKKTTSMTTQSVKLPKIETEAKRRLGGAIVEKQANLAVSRFEKKEKTHKIRVKRVRDQIEEQARQQIKLAGGLDEEKKEILKRISKDRLKVLKHIAIKFPKLVNLEENPKFKQAIAELYESSDLTKYAQAKKRRSVDAILEEHKPERVLERNSTKNRSSRLAVVDLKESLPRLTRVMTLDVLPEK